MNTHIFSTRISKQTRYSFLLIALAFSAYTSCANAESTALRVPLTPTEASNLGLDPGHDGALFRVLQTNDGPVSKGATINYAISAREQRGASSDVFLQETADGRWCEIGSGNAFADIAVNLPSGAVLSNMRIWGYDASVSNDLTVSLIERCTPNSQSGGVFTSVIKELSSSGNAGNFTEIGLTVSNNSIDNDACTYTLRTRYSTPGETNFCAGSNLRLQKIRFSYSQ